MGESRMRRLDMPTAAGACPVLVHSPDAQGRWPGIILFMDGPGLRPAVQAIAARLAAAGYAVLLPDLFHRAGPYPPVDPRRVFADPELKADHRARLMATATPANVMSDIDALLALMATIDEVAAGPLGVVGYCMGGRLALIAAGTFPERIAVAAAFHAGGLADDRPTSPHLLARSIRAEVYVGAARDDPSFPPAMSRRLETALAEAGVEHRIEVYPAGHGWVPDDTAAHDPVAAEQHWRVLVPLLDRTLKGR